MNQIAAVKRLISLDVKDRDSLAHFVFELELLSKSCHQKYLDACCAFKPHCLIDDQYHFSCSNEDIDYYVLHMEEMQAAVSQAKKCLLEFNLKYMEEYSEAHPRIW